jgi:hypothetical protein
VIINVSLSDGVYSVTTFILFFLRRIPLCNQKVNTKRKCTLCLRVLLEVLLVSEKAKKFLEVYDHIHNCLPIAALQVRLYNQGTN